MLKNGREKKPYYGCEQCSFKGEQPHNIFFLIYTTNSVFCTLRCLKPMHLKNENPNSKKSINRGGMEKWEIGIIRTLSYYF